MSNYSTKSSKLHKYPKPDPVKITLEIGKRAVAHGLQPNKKFRSLNLNPKVLIKRLKLWSKTFPPFFKVALSKNGLLSPDGRQLIWGKFRRLVISAIPFLPEALQQHYGLKGGCDSCGASCSLLFQCPHFDTKTRLCQIYEDRPNICRTFPITPADIEDRNLVLKTRACGFVFTSLNKTPEASNQTKEKPKFSS